MTSQTEQSLNSNFCEEEYKNLESDYIFFSKHVELLTTFIQKEILPCIPHQNFLDIGPGPGFITKPIAKNFASTTIVEPNNFYIHFYENSNYLLNINNFEDSNLNNKYDLILCSHVLYHVQRKNWQNFTKQIYDLLRHEGKAIITLVAPRGVFHELCSSIRTDYSNSSILVKTVNSLNIPIEIERAGCFYRTNDYNYFKKLVSMFVIDDCFTPNEFEMLSNKEKKLIEFKIEKFIEDCKKCNGIYEYVSEEDYLVLSKPSNLQGSHG